jgi:hypothetical protein
LRSYQVGENAVISEFWVRFIFRRANLRSKK